MNTEQFLISDPCRFKNNKKVEEMFVSCGFNVDVESDNLVIYSDYYNLYDYVALINDGEVIGFFLEDDEKVSGLETVSLHEAIQMLLAPDEIFSCTTVGIDRGSADGELVVIVEGGEINRINLYDKKEALIFQAKINKIREKLKNPKLAYIVDNREMKYGKSYQFEVEYHNDNNIVLTSMTGGSTEKYCIAEIYQMNPEFYNEDEI